MVEITVAGVALFALPAGYFYFRNNITGFVDRQYSRVFGLSAA